MDFTDAWLKARKEAEALGVRLRPMAKEDALPAARRALTGNRTSDGFAALEKLGRLDLTLEALVVDRRYTAQFSDQEANAALTRLLEAGYGFRRA